MKPNVNFEVSGTLKAVNALITTSFSQIKDSNKVLWDKFLIHIDCFLIRGKMKYRETRVIKGRGLGGAGGGCVEGRLRGGGWGEVEGRLRGAGRGGVEGRSKGGRGEVERRLRGAD